MSAAEITALQIASPRKRDRWITPNRGEQGVFSSGGRLGLVRGFRLPGKRTEELEDLWSLESLIGMGTRYFVDFEMAMGVRHTGGGDGVALVAAENWLRLSRKRREELMRAHRAVRLVGRKTEGVLFWRYGMRDGETYPSFPSDVAALVPYTDVVERRRRQMASDLAEQRIARARAAAEQGEQLWVTKRAWLVGIVETLREKLAAHTADPSQPWDLAAAKELAATEKTLDLGDRMPSRLSKAARSSAEAAIRRGANLETTRQVVMRRALQLPQGKGEALAAAREAKEEFITEATKQANQLLVDAGKAYQDAWWRSG